MRFLARRAAPKAKVSGETRHGGYVLGVFCGWDKGQD